MNDRYHCESNDVILRPFARRSAEISGGSTVSIDNQHSHSLELIGYLGSRTQRSNSRRTIAGTRNRESSSISWSRDSFSNECLGSVPRK